jgi:hypothetical protein
MFQHVPPNERAEFDKVQQQSRQGLRLGAVIVSSSASVVPGNSYLLRSVSQGRDDILVLVTVSNRTDDGGVVLLWKIVRAFAQPSKL